MRLPNLNALRMFDASARHLNFRLAAEELNVTQGAVAQQVRRLEADLGHKLFHREARGLRLTDTGRGYHIPIRKAMMLIERASSDLAMAEEQITISVPPSLASKWLVPRLTDFEQKHPGLHLRVVAEERVSDFRWDGIDLAIRQGHAPKDPEVRFTCLSLLNLVAVARDDVALTLGKSPDIKDLSRVTLIQDSHRFLDQLLHQYGLEPKGRVLRFNQTSLAMDAAMNGQGVTLIPRIFLGDHPLEILWRAPPQDDQGFYLIWPDRRNDTRDLVVNWLMSQ